MCPCLQEFSAEFTSEQGASCSLGGMICLTRSAKSAAEAKWAEGAGWIALRTPKPPHQVGNDAWVRAESLRQMFRMAHSKDLTRESMFCSSGERKHGEMGMT